MRPVLFALAVAVIVPPVTRAERPPQKKSEAELVFEGEVTDVEVAREDSVDYYLVSIKVAKVVKGDVLTVGKMYKVAGWQVTKFKPGTAGAAGHLAFPKKGDRVKAYANKYETRGGFDALYPDWFDRPDKDGKPKK